MDILWWAYFACGIYSAYLYLTDKNEAVGPNGTLGEELARLGVAFFIFLFGPFFLIIGYITKKRN